MLWGRFTNHEALWLGDELLSLDPMRDGAIEKAGKRRGAANVAVFGTTPGDSIQHDAPERISSAFAEMRYGCSEWRSCGHLENWNHGGQAVRVKPSQVTDGRRAPLDAGLYSKSHV